MREFITINDRLSTFLPTVGVLGDAAREKITIVQKPHIVNIIVNSFIIQYALFKTLNDIASMSDIVCL
jgi:hypothetical protein